MTIQQLIFSMKEDGWSDAAIRVGVCRVLSDRDYQVTNMTHLVIEKYLNLYSECIDKEVA